MEGGDRKEAGAQHGSKANPEKAGNAALQF